MEKPKHKLKNDEADAELALQLALDFTLEDLEANRDGRLSQTQRARWAATERTCLIISVFESLLLVWSIVNAGGRIDVAIGQGNFVWLFLAAITGYCWYRWKQCFDDLRAPEISALQGRVDLEIAGNGKNSTLKLSIQDVQFNVTKDLFLAFKNGDPYAIYYASRSKTLLSAEWLRQE